MRLVLVGLSHRTAAVEVRERIVFSRDELRSALSTLGGHGPLDECVILSTCNRTEVLGARREETTQNEAVECIRDFLSSSRSIETEQLNRSLYVYHGLEVVRHLFRVASSLDSMIVGEPQILGQVKDAYYESMQAGQVGARLDPLLQRAFAVAKKVRTETQVGRNPVSISQVATDLARRIFGSLENRAVMVIGSGQMAELAAKHLVKAGVMKVYVSSRTFHRAQDTANRVGGIPVAFDRFKDHLAEVDIVISSTAAPHHIVPHEMGRQMMKERRGRPIFFIDIAVPRDIDPSLNEIDNIYLYNIDDLQHAVDRGTEERLREAGHAEVLIEEEIAKYSARFQADLAKPVIVAMREKLQAMGRQEMRHYRHRLGPLSESQESVVDELVASIVRKILHGPTRELKRLAAGGDGDAMVELIHRMFDLKGDDEADVRNESSEN